VGDLAVLHNPAGNPDICPFEITTSQLQVLGGSVLIITRDNTVEEVDYNRCEVVAQYFSLSDHVDVFEADTRSSLNISSANIFESDELAVSVEPYHDSETSYLGAVLIVDLTDNSVDRIIEDAANAVWSPDGVHLAYIGVDGLYVVETGTFSVEHFIPISDLTVPGFYANAIRWRPWSPVPQWSQDGTKLIYHRHLDAKYLETNTNYDIYMFDLVTGTESLIVENGVNPTWIPSGVPDT
jgi:hypothetical protein